MKIVIPSVEVLSVTPNPEQLIEYCGRICYKSEDKITSASAEAFIEKILKLGHHSVLEHAVATIKFMCDRGVTHELVRHRLASYSQESTRYCNYGKGKHGGEISVIQPPCLAEDQHRAWERGCACAEAQYLELLRLGAPPQIARSVLPICLKTEIAVTANFREWRHIFKLRTAKAAHPQIRALMIEALDKLRVYAPTVFKEI